MFDVLHVILIENEKTIGSGNIVVLYVETIK